MAAGAALRGLDLVVLDEFSGPLGVGLTVDFNLVGVPVEIGDLVERADVGLRVAVTVEAEAHAERLRVSNCLHSIDLPVAADTGNAAVYVDGVVKVNVVRHLMDAHPVDRFAGLISSANRGEQWAVGPDLAVAVHTGLRGGQIGHTGFFDIRMTIAAIQTELVHV